MKITTESKALALATAASAVALVIPLGVSYAMKSPPAPPAAIVSAADVSAGRHLFLMNCAACHGDDARGDEGPDLHDLHKSDARIYQVVTSGIKGEMPAFGKKLGEADVHSLIAFLHTLKN